MNNKKISAKDYLEQLQELDTFINQEIERIRELKERSTSTGAIRYDQERVQTSPKNALEVQIVNYVALEEKLNSQIDKFVDSKEHIIEQIREIHNNTYIQILFKVYVQYKTLGEVADEIGKSYRYVIELHKKALNLFEEVHNDLHYFT